MENVTYPWNGKVSWIDEWSNVNSPHSRFWTFVDRVLSFVLFLLSNVIKITNYYLVFISNTIRYTSNQIIPFQCATHCLNSLLRFVVIIKIRIQRWIFFLFWNQSTAWLIIVFWIFCFDQLLFRYITGKLKIISLYIDIINSTEHNLYCKYLFSSFSSHSSGT